MLETLIFILFIRMTVEKPGVRLFVLIRIPRGHTSGFLGSRLITRQELFMWSFMTGGIT